MSFRIVFKLAQNFSRNVHNPNMGKENYIKRAYIYLNLFSWLCHIGYFRHGNFSSLNNPRAADALFKNNVHSVPSIDLAEQFFKSDTR